MALIQPGRMTKGRKREGRADPGSKQEGRREGQQLPQGSKSCQSVEKERRGGRKAPTSPTLLPLPRPANLWHKHTVWGRGAHAHWRPATTATAPGGGQDRLEPVRAGGARPRAGASQGEEAAHGSRIPAPGGCGVRAEPCPSPQPLSPACSCGTVQVCGPAPAPSPPRGPCSAPAGSRPGAELGRGEPKNTRPLPPHTSHLARFSAQPQWPRGNVYGKPLALLLPISPASLGVHGLAAPGNEIFLSLWHAMLSFPFSWEIPGGALKAKLLKLYRKDGLWVW